MGRINASLIPTEMIQLQSFGHSPIEASPKPTMSLVRTTFSVYKTAIAFYKIPCPYPASVGELLNFPPETFPSRNSFFTTFQNYIGRTMTQYPLIVHSAIGTTMKRLKAIGNYAVSFHNGMITWEHAASQ